MKVVHRQIINESHPVVQQLVDVYGYDLEASSEVVQLFGTLERAMDYLTRRDTEEMVTPTVAIVGPSTDER